MDFEFIMYHFLSGCIPVFLAVAIYFAILYVVEKKQIKWHIILSFVFCFYLTGVLAATGIAIKGSFAPRIVYIPFVDMIRGPIETFLNVILFIPLGFFLPFLYKKYNRLANIVLAGFLISLSIELVQMFDIGTTDINDLIANTLGTCLGFSIYKTFKKAVPESWINQTQVDGFQCYYELLFFWIGSLVIMLTAQRYIFNILFAAKF